VNYSTYSKSVELGFTEPYLFDKNIALGGDIFRRDYNSFNYTNNGDRNTTYQQLTTGFQLRTGVPLTEFVSVAGRYGLSYDQVTLDRNTYYFDSNGDGTLDTCDPLIAGRYLCDALGNRLTSSIGYSLVYDNLNNGIRPTRGQRAVFSQDFAGLGGDVRYLRSRIEASKYWDLGSKFIASIKVEGGYILPFGSDRGEGVDKVRLTDRFFLGEPQIRGFGIRGIGPRVVRVPYVTAADGSQALSTDRSQFTDDALGGRAYYLGRAELELPLGAGAKELGLRPSLFIDAGAVFGTTRPVLQDYQNGNTALIRPVLSSTGGLQCIDQATSSVVTPRPATGCTTGNTAYQNVYPGFQEQYYGDTPKPRVSVGFGVNWNSPFGPFRIDIAKALLKEPGDRTKLFTFNVGTQF
jgi:outer membrane protein insertion porin family